MASDNGVPSLRTYEVVKLTVTRNENTPTWIQPNSNQQFRATTSVLETVGFNTNIYNLQAQDFDNSAPFNTLKFTVIGDGEGPLYFNVGEINGEVTLRSALYQDNAAQYIVGLIWKHIFINISENDSCLI